MHYSLELPVAGPASTSSGATSIARAAEDAGFAMLGYTDHPAPSARWLAAGGHPTLDPFAGLAFVAAVTTRVRLMTYLAVLPYRNPLLLAKSIATVDRLSDGRLTVVAGTGYLRSEFAALGRSFEDRNALFDEAVDVVRSVYVDDEFAFDGAGFSARGVIHRPSPVQLPHPPIWIGGSSRASRRRVARHGDGWSPLYLPEVAAPAVRTASLATDAALAEAVDDLHALVAAEGRDPAAISVQVDGVVTMDAEPSRTVDRVGEMAAIGVTHVVVRTPAGTIPAMVDAIDRFGAEVIDPTAPPTAATR